MPAVASIPKGLAGVKVSATRKSVTGTGGIATGLNSVLAGSVSLTVTSDAATLTTAVPSVTTISGGTVNAKVTLLTYAGPTIALSGVATNVDCLCLGS